MPPHGEGSGNGFFPLVAGEPPVADAGKDGPQGMLAHHGSFQGFRCLVVRACKARTEDGKRYARAKSVKTLASEELLKRVTSGTRLSRGEARLVLDRVVEELKIAIAQGFRVHVGDLGYFSPQLSAGYSEDSRCKSPQVRAVGLLFAPEKEVKQYLASIDTVRTVNVNRAINGIDEASLHAALRAHFEQEQTVTRRQFQFDYPHISRTSLCNYFRRCVEQGILCNVGTKNAPVYRKGKAWDDTPSSGED